MIHRLLSLLLGVLALGACAYDAAPEQDKGDVLILPDDVGPDADMLDAGPAPDAHLELDADEFGCSDYCVHLFGCLEQICPSDVTSDPKLLDCLNACLTTSEFHRYIPAMLTYSCPQMQELACSGMDAVASDCDCSAVEIPTTNVGAPCTGTGDCTTGELSPLCIPETQSGDPTGFRGGYCSSQGCQTNGACGVGNLCVFGGGPSQCYAGCSSDGQCRSGYSCWPAPPTPTGFCMPACGGGTVCGGGSVCVRGACSPPPTCSTAAPCPANLQCRSSQCLTIPCTDNTGCLNGLVCADGICN